MNNFKFKIKNLVDSDKMYILVDRGRCQRTISEVWKI